MYSKGVLPDAYRELETDKFPVSKIQIKQQSLSIFGTLFFSIILDHTFLISRIVPSVGFLFSLLGLEI